MNNDHCHYWWITMNLLEMHTLFWSDAIRG